jgi:hypothetical protein
MLSIVYVFVKCGNLFEWSFANYGNRLSVSNVF